MVAPSLAASIFWGVYESAEVRFVRRWLDPDLDCLELGSGIGLVSREIARMLRPGRRLVCLEPREDLLACAQENVSRIAVELCCRYIAAVVTGREGPEATFPLQEDWINARWRDSVADGIKCRAVTLEEVASEFQGRFQLVSDIEGAEEGFLLQESSRDVLERCFRMIIELHDTERASVEELIGRIRALGFQHVDRYGAVCVFVRP